MPSNLRSKIHSGPVKRSCGERRRHRLEPVGKDIGARLHRSRASVLLQQGGNRGRAAEVSHVQGGGAVAGEDIRVGAVRQEDARRLDASQRCRPMQRRALRDVPVIQAAVDRCRILEKPRRDMLEEIKRHGVVQIDRAVRSHPCDDRRLLAVIGPAERCRVKRVVPVARVGAARHEPLHHREVAAEGGAVQGGTIIDANHIPVAVLLEQEIDRLALLRDICEEQRQPDGVARGHLSLVASGQDEKPALGSKEAAEQIHTAEGRRRQDVRHGPEGHQLFGGARSMIGQRSVQAAIARQIDGGAVFEEDVDERPDSRRHWPACW